VFDGLFGILPGRFVGTEAAGFHVEATQAEFARFRIVRHALELGAGIVVFAFDEGGLRIEKMDQRFLIGAEQAAGTDAHLAGKKRVARAGRDQAGRQCLITTVTLASAKITADRIGRGPDDADDPPQKHDGADQRDHQRGCNHKARFDQVVLPGDGEQAGTIGKPGEAPAETENDEKENEKSDHSVFRPQP